LQKSLDITVNGFSPSSLISNPRFLHPKLTIDSNNRNCKLLLSNSNNDETNDETSNKKKAQKNDLTKMTPLDRAMQKARAKLEIDRLTNGPGAIYDQEADIEKLIGGISSGLEYNSPDTLEDLKYYNLESKLSKAIQKADFEDASELRKTMDSLHIDDCGFVLQANSAFYKAFSDKDYEAMKAIWMDENSAQCVHPSTPPIMGFANIMRSWKKMFQSADKNNDKSGFHLNTIEPTSIRLSVKGATAWLTCDEEVFVPKFVRGVGKKKELIKKMMATNIFRKVNGKWLMVHHHANLHVDSDKKKSKKDRNSKSSSAIQSTTINLDGLGGEILGNPSLDSGDESNSNGPVKRVFMGSLSDLLNGGLGDILGDDDLGDNDGKDESGKTIIRVNSSFDDDDDDDDDEEDITENISLSDLEDLNDSSPAAESKSNQAVPKDALRQNCISALRKLANQVRYN